MPITYERIIVGDLSAQTAHLQELKQKMGSAIVANNDSYQESLDRDFSSALKAVEAVLEFMERPKPNQADELYLKVSFAHGMAYNSMVLLGESSIEEACIATMAAREYLRQWCTAPAGPMANKLQPCPNHLMPVASRTAAACDG
jgi:hypothetical protein